MVRKKAKDSKVDTELVYAYAKTKQLGPLEEFISSPNQANLQVSFSTSVSSCSTVCCLPVNRYPYHLCEVHICSSCSYTHCQYVLV